MPRSCHNTHSKVLLVKVQTLMYTPHTTGVQSYWMSGRHLLQIIVIYSTCDQQVHELCVDCKRICESHGIKKQPIKRVNWALRDQRRLETSNYWYTRGSNWCYVNDNHTDCHRGLQWKVNSIYTNIYLGWNSLGVYCQVSSRSLTMAFYNRIFRGFPREHQNALRIRKS